MAVCAAATLAAGATAHDAHAHRGHFAARIAQRQHDYDVARATHRPAGEAPRGKRYWQRREALHERRTLAWCRYPVARVALREARRLHAPYRAKLALIEAGIVESGLRNLTWGDRDSVGWLQVRLGLHGRLAVSVTASARVFLVRGFTGRGGAIRLARRTRFASGTIAQLVQGSAFPRRYGRVKAKAARVVRACG